MRPVGEVEFANGVAAMSASGLYGDTQLCAGIAAHADLTLGQRVAPVLDAMERAGGGRFRGIRHNSSHDPEVRMPAPPGLLRDAAFQDGFGRLQARGLTFDAWMYHPQLPDLVALMQRFPDATVVLNHIGGRIGIGSYADQGIHAVEAWRSALEQLAGFRNLHVKLGGLGMALAGYGFHARPEPPSSDELAAAWQPAVATCIELFGAERCMFESNFPVDLGACSYPVLWNAFKLIAKDYSAAEKTALFSGTAKRVYRLDV
jgi:predicted TIM-barrel fold metal-dependent hydrolase